MATYHPADWSATDQCDSQSEGLAAKLEEVHHKNGPPLSSPGSRHSLKRKAENGLSAHTSEVDSDDDDEMMRQTQTDSTVNGSGGTGRRVRARSLIDDTQLAVLKSYYAINPRPKKEEINFIANYIKFPTRVVQVGLTFNMPQSFSFFFFCS